MTGAASEVQGMIIQIRSGEVSLPGELVVPAGAQGLVVFAHGTGSSRNSPRSRYIAEVLQEARFGTLLFDLLTVEEERAERLSAHLRFDIDLLARRLTDATAALQQIPGACHLPIGYLGAETGAAAALIAAAQHPDLVCAVVSRGGRPDLIDPAALAAVRAPALFIAAEYDRAVLSVNRQAASRMQNPPELRVVTGASHFFEEPGALDRVANLARDWFELHLAAHLRYRQMPA